MNDFNDKLRERWQDKRKKSFNWTKVILMMAALIAIVFVMTRLNQVDNINWQNSAPQADTTQTPGQTQ